MGKKYRWLQTNWDRFLVSVYTFFILYTTLVPFRFAKDPQYILKKLSRIEWRLYLFHQGFYSGSDILVNVMLFIPLGFFLAVSRQLRSLRPLRSPDFIRIFFQGLVVSTAVESLQIFTYNRHPSVSDVFNNTVGTCLGAIGFYLLAPTLLPRIRRMLRQWFESRPDNIMAVSLLGMLILIQLAPFDFGLNTHVLYRQIRRFMADPWQLNLLFPSEFLVLFLMYAQVGYFFIRGWSSGSGRGTGTKKAWLFLILLPVFLEMVQFSVPDRRHSLLDVWAAWSAQLFVAYQMRKHGRKTEPAVLPFMRDHSFFKKLLPVYGGLILYHLFILPILNWGQADVTANWRYFLDPFAWLLRKDRMLTVVRFMEAATLFFPLGFFSRFFWGKQYSVKTLLVGGLFLALMTEGLQIWSLPLAAHWSQVIAGMLGMWAGLDFEAFYEELYRPGDNTGIEGA